MKRISMILASVVAITLLSFNAQAQGDTKYFLGKWDVLVEGLPQGNVKMVVRFEEKDGKLAGVIIGEDGTEMPFTSVTTKENSATAYFTAQGYDVFLTLNKKDEDNVTGTMMDMFTASGTRAK